jgi:hypothetical protein
LPIIQINCLPVWVISGPEGSSIDIKLIREDEIPLLRGVLKRWLSVCALGRRGIDETDVVDQFGNLTTGICTTIVERALCCLVLHREVAINWIASTNKGAFVGGDFEGVD